MDSYGTLQPDSSETSQISSKKDRNNERHIILEVLIHLKHRVWQKKLLTVVVLVMGALVALDFWKFGYIKQGSNHFLEWIKIDPLLGFVSLTILVALAVVIFIPPTIIVIISSFVFSKEYGQLHGIMLAFLASFFGAVVGANISYFRSKYMMRDLVELFSHRYKTIQAADSVLKTNGFHVMLLLRLCSIIPFSALNYIGGVTDVTLYDFNLSLVGIIPTFVIDSIIGGTVETLIASDASLTRIRLWTLVIGCVAGIIALFITIRLSRIELRKQIESERSGSTFDLQEQSRLLTKKTDYEQGVDDEEWFWLWA